MMIWERRFWGARKPNEAFPRNCAGNFIWGGAASTATGMFCDAVVLAVCAEARDRVPKFYRYREKSITCRMYRNFGEGQAQKLHI